MVKTPRLQQQCITCNLAAKSKFALLLGKVILPVVNQLSYLPFKLRRNVPPEQYEHAMHNIAHLVASALESVAVDRTALEQKIRARPVTQTVTVQYGEPRHWYIRLTTPLARALYLLLHDLVKLDERWTAYAWNSEVRRQITPDFLLHSELAELEKWQHERLLEAQQLCKAIRSQFKKLRHALQPQPTTPQEEACPANGSDR